MNYPRILQVLWLGWLIYWLAYWSGNKATVRQSNPGGRLLAFILFVGLYVGLYRHEGEWSRQILPHTEAMAELGVMLTAAGLGFSIWARRILGKNWSANPTVKQNHELITAGPYRFVRHPIYTGLLLALFATFVIARGELRDFFFFGAIAVMLHFKAQVEEKFMLQTFPEAYPAYRRRIKAIIPFIL